MEKFEIKLVFPIRSYLKKFIGKYTCVEPFQITAKKCHFSAIILEPLSKKIVVIEKCDKKRLNAELHCTFDSVTDHEKKFWVSSAAIISIDWRLKELFDQQLIDFVTMNHSKQSTIDDNILRFLEYYDITEDDLTLDAAKKMYYRARTYVPKEKSEKINKVISQQMKLDF